MEAPDLDDDLRDVHEFDSIDAIELLREIEVLLNTQLTREEKKAAMDIRTINHIVDYVAELAQQRCPG
ncbi:MAG: phosphopantetheine-binding protein [Desulfobacteraceae bacterium]